MDQFSPAELAELFHLRESVIDTQFQFWITITFATIVASFVGAKRLNRRLRASVALLYAIATVVMTSRWYYAATEAILFRDRLIEFGVPMDTPWMTIVSRITLVALGTSMTLDRVPRSGVRVMSLGSVELVLS